MNAALLRIAVCTAAINVAAASTAGAAQPQANAPLADQQITQAGTQASIAPPTGWGKRVQVIHPGDLVWCPPAVKHWHGAAPTTAVTLLTITGTVDGKNVNWMEKVSDAQYNAR